VFVGRFSEKLTAWSRVEVPFGSVRLPAMRRTAVAGLALALALAGCGGGKDFANKPRPPVTLELTGVITKDEVTISPRKVGAGPVVITVSNQSGGKRMLVLDGNGIQESVGPISNLDTAKLQKTLTPGRYTVKAGSEAATATEIKPATLVIGKERASASDKVLLP
jgi:hypothetical protein